jgi:hypothetical protein
MLVALMHLGSSFPCLASAALTTLTYLYAGRAVVAGLPTTLHADPLHKIEH